MTSSRTYVYISMHILTKNEGETSVLQCVAVCCSVLQCVAACCSVLQRVAVCTFSQKMRGKLP